jgi:hypothetical protein
VPIEEELRSVGYVAPAEAAPATEPSAFPPPSRIEVFDIPVPALPVGLPVAAPGSKRSADSAGLLGLRALQEESTAVAGHLSTQADPAGSVGQPPHQELQVGDYVAQHLVPRARGDTRVLGGELCLWTTRQIRNVLASLAKADPGACAEVAVAALIGLILDTRLSSSQRSNVLKEIKPHLPATLPPAMYDRALIAECTMRLDERPRPVLESLFEKYQRR